MKDREKWSYFKFETVGGSLKVRKKSKGLFRMVVVRCAELDII